VSRGRARCYARAPCPSTLRSPRTGATAATCCRVSRTFAINIRLLAGDFADAVRIAYLLCRIADTLEDSLPAPAATMRERFGALRAAIAGDAGAAESLARVGADAAAATTRGAAPMSDASPARDRGRAAELALLAELPAVLRASTALAADDRVAIAACLDAMTGGMARYSARAAERGAAVAYLDDEGELHDYCWTVAGCVGVMLTRLFERRSPARDAREELRRIELAPVVGEALQLTNIVLDWPADVRRGRCFVPAAWLAEHGLAPRDLVGAERPGVKALERRLEALARAALARVPDYLALIPRRALRYRLFVLWPSLWAHHSLDHAVRDPEFPWGATRPKLPRAELWRVALTSTFSGDGAAELRTARAPAG